MTGTGVRERESICYTTQKVMTGSDTTRGAKLQGI